MQPEGRDPDGYEEPATSMMDQRRGIGGPAAPLLPHVILLCDGSPPPLLSGCDIPGRAGAVDQRRGRGRPAAPLLLNVVILYGGLGRAPMWANEPVSRCGGGSTLPVEQWSPYTLPSSPHLSQQQRAPLALAWTRVAKDSSDANLSGSAQIQLSEYQSSNTLPTPFPRPKDMAWTRGNNAHLGWQCSPQDSSSPSLRW